MIIKKRRIIQEELFPILENIMRAMPNNGEIFDFIIGLLENTPFDSPLFSAAQLKADEIIFTQHLHYLKPEHKLAKYCKASYFYGRSLTEEGKYLADMLAKKITEMLP